MAKFYVLRMATHFDIKEVVADTKQQAEKIAYDSGDNWKIAYQSDNWEHFQTFTKKEAKEEGWLNEEVS